MKHSKHILVLGSGRSSGALIRYLAQASEDHGWTMTVADRDRSLAQQKVAEHPTVCCEALDALDAGARGQIIAQHKVVVSLLPAYLHDLVAEDCIEMGCHLFTASYASRSLREKADDIIKRDLTFLVELGLDPGLDHMSAMADIDRIRSLGGQISSFSSFAGGLVAPECCDNPWQYKFTWNPFNVVRAGQTGALYIKQDRQVVVPYHRLFASHMPIPVRDLGVLEGYPNRDSSMYKVIYGLEDTETVIRGTLRYKGFCDPWQALVDAGLTNDGVKILVAPQMTWREFAAMFPGLMAFQTEPEQEQSDIGRALHWLGLFSDTPILMEGSHTPAECLEQLLIRKWQLQPEDRDFVVMQHQIRYELPEGQRNSTSTLLEKGEPDQTAMSTLVGLPLAIAVKLFLLGELRISGLHLPVVPLIYRPILRELETMDIRFHHQDEAV
ncbi:MAG: saccharopine dehydrogenase NADP-binding domain-containing protein [Saprospiraceae bacterium]|nr:saccharopine dehydrogenase NADP-binding domain-containing protein [Saprospiraceae bacterium]